MVYLVRVTTFDRVLYNALVSIIIVLGVAHHLSRLISSFITDCSVRVAVNGI